MMRTVTMPADLATQALDDLKGWLGITRPAEDALLTDLLSASLAVCEAFIGQMPIEQEITETLMPVAGWQCLTARPVRAVISAREVAPDGTSTPIDTGALDFRTSPEGVGAVLLPSTPADHNVTVTVRAGIAADWRALPGPLRQGIVRLAAFHYRDRETGRDATPPASVTALWRPWRVLRLT